MISRSRNNSKFIPPNEKGHSKKCHSPLLLFHAGHHSDISRQFTLSILVTTAAIIPDPKVPQDWWIWCLITSQNFVIRFANQRFNIYFIQPLNICLTFQFMDLVPWRNGFTVSVLPTSSYHPFSLFPKNFVVSPFTIISQQGSKLLLLLLPEQRSWEIAFEALFPAF